jgi:hypothetical protein
VDQRGSARLGRSSPEAIGVGVVDGLQAKSASSAGDRLVSISDGQRRPPFYAELEQVLLG